MDTYRAVDLGNIFDDVPDVVLRWITALAMAANDLGLDIKHIREYGDHVEAHYFFRLSFAHLREIAKVIGKGDRNKEIRSFLEKLDGDTQVLYKDIVKSIGQFNNGGLTKDVLRPIRNECFHYPDINGRESSFKDLPKLLKALEKKRVRFSETDKSMLGHRYLFADAVVGFTVNSRLSKEVVDQISNVVMKIIQLVDYSLDYLKRQNHKYETKV